jgi:hypothetical protein
MSEQRGPGGDWSVAVPGVAAMCAVLGTVALPLVFGAGLGAGTAAPAWQTPLWLGVAGVTSVYLLILMPRLSQLLAAQLWQRLDAAQAITRSQIRLLARLVVFGIEIDVIQAILRRPLAVLLGGERSAAPIEAAVAAIALALLLALLVWIYQTARPMVQGLTLRAIDAAIPTVGSQPVAEVTLPAPVDNDATLRSPTAGEDTVRSPRSGEETLRSPRSGAETLKSPPTSEETVRSPRSP